MYNHIHCLIGATIIIDNSLVGFFRASLSQPKRPILKNKRQNNILLYLARQIFAVLVVVGSSVRRSSLGARSSFSYRSRTVPACLYTNRAVRAVLRHHAPHPYPPEAAADATPPPTSPSPSRAPPRPAQFAN